MRGLMKSLREYLLMIIPVLVIILVSCNDLSEEPYGQLTPDNFYQSKDEVISGLADVYQRLYSSLNYSTSYKISELGTDEFIIAPLATGGWLSGERWIETARHEVPPNSTAMSQPWDAMFGVVGAANALIPNLQASPAAPQVVASATAEAQLLRAYAYFKLMDWFGNVPIFTKKRVNQSDLPATNTRQEVFDFVVTEMKAAAEDLPSINQVERSSYYPRFTKEVAYGFLARVYLNAEVYTGTPQWELARDYADKVIQSGGYMLEPNIVDNFNSTNRDSRENMAADPADPFKNAGGNVFVRGTMTAEFGDAWNLPFTPANGYKALSPAVERYKSKDVRYQNFVYEGLQDDPNGNPIISNETGKQLKFIKFIEPSRVSRAEKPGRGVYTYEGYRILKFVPDGNFKGRYATNDFPILRYAHVLMIKAEALYRLANSSQKAINLVNKIRTRSNVKPWASLTLKRIENERAREFVMEGNRRTDMIRFGSYFSETWPTKPNQTEEFRGLYPIPKEAINSNPRLEQNPDY